MCFAIEDLFFLTDAEQPQLGPTPGRIVAASPHFPALLRRLVELTARFREPQPSHPGSYLAMMELALSALRRLVATQPRARWLLLAPGSQLQWRRDKSVWEAATGERTLQGSLKHLATCSAPFITPAAGDDARAVRAPIPHPLSGSPPRKDLSVSLYLRISLLLRQHSAVLLNVLIVFAHTVGRLGTRAHPRGHPFAAKRAVALCCV
jgi:hypothetical protein